MATAVLGMQWGDEGKGKITHLLARDADVVVRFNGGPNAGHTLIDRGVRFAPISFRQACSIPMSFRSWRTAW